MATNAQLIRKLAQGDSLLESEIAQLERAFDQYDNAAEIVRAHTDLGSRRLRIPQNLEILFSEVLTVDTASILVPIPAEYKTILFYGSGSITSANGGNIWAQFQGDTAGNYLWQAVEFNHASVTGFDNTDFPGSNKLIGLGVFGTTGAGAGVNGSFRSELIHAHSEWKKNVLSQTYTAEFNNLYLLGSTWQNVSPIDVVEIFGTDNTLVKGTTNIAKGSLLSVYGLR